MTPKEKAFDLIRKFIPCDIGTLSIDKVDWDYMEYEFRCSPLEHALIAVDEILNTNTLKERSCGYITLSEKHIEYWEEVKKEIEKL